MKENLFAGVADTLYLPLTARIYVSEYFPDYFHDEKALSLKGEIPYETIRNKTSEYFEMAGACRFRELDRMVADYIRKHRGCNIVNLGCGLETSYFRLRPAEDAAQFYEMDLPEVIDVRRRVLQETPNEHLIAGDLFDLSWADTIDRTRPTLLTVIGVFQYFDEARVLPFLRQVKELFPGVGIIFDAMTHAALTYANNHVKKTGNASASMHFGVDDPAALAAATGYTLAEARPFFKAARNLLKGRLKLYTRIAMKMVDEGKMRGYLIHLRDIR